METLNMSFWPSCSACPEAEIIGDEARIGEMGNRAVLRKEEWNVLVDLISLDGCRRPHSFWAHSLACSCTEQLPASS